MTPTLTANRTTLKNAMRQLIRAHGLARVTMALADAAFQEAPEAMGSAVARAAIRVDQIDQQQAVGA